jgi:hypothetical protein
MELRSGASSKWFDLGDRFFIRLRARAMALLPFSRLLSQNSV